MILELSDIHRPVARKFSSAVFLKEMWTFATAVKIVIPCVHIAHIHECLYNNEMIVYYVHVLAKPINTAIYAGYSVLH